MKADYLKLFLEPSRGLPNATATPFRSTISVKMISEKRKTEIK
jgi:hypothetical protein